MYVLHSLDDEILAFGPTERQFIRLKDKGADIQLKVVSGMTHFDVEAFAAPLQEAVPWLQEAWNGR